MPLKTYKGSFQLPQKIPYSKPALSEYPNLDVFRRKGEGHSSPLTGPLLGKKCLHYGGHHKLANLRFLTFLNISYGHL